MFDIIEGEFMVSNFIRDCAKKSNSLKSEYYLCNINEWKNVRMRIKMGIRIRIKIKIKIRNQTNMF